MRSLALRCKSGESPSAPQMPGEGCAIDILAALVERYQHGFVGNRSRNRGGFLGHPGRGVARAAFRNFMNLEAAKAELAADVVEAFPIALGQFPLRALLQPADCNDDEAHPVQVPANR